MGSLSCCAGAPAAGNASLLFWSLGACAPAPEEWADLASIRTWVDIDLEPAMDHLRQQSPIFCPETHVTREEMAAFVGRTLGLYR